MSGRCRRSEMLWDKQDQKMPSGEGRKILWQGKDHHSSVCRDSSPKWSNSEAIDGMMPGNFSGWPSWEPLQGNGNMAEDDDINKERQIMQTDPTFDEWGKQYSTRPSDDSHDLPYRGLQRGAGGSARMSRDRSWSPYQSRGRGSARGVSRSRSRSRSRGRDWESTGVRSRSPFCDDRRESNEYADVRNNHRVASRPCKDFAAGGDCRKGSHCRFFNQEILNSRGGGNQRDNNWTESWNRRPDGSRYSGDGNSSDRCRNMGSDGYKKDTRHVEVVRDIPKDAYLCKDSIKGRGHKEASCRLSQADNYHRNLYDGQERRRQLNRDSRIPCRFFSAGKCNRDNCKFSHDAPESGRYDGRSHENIRGHIGNKNRTWNDQQPHDDLNASNIKSNFGDKNKSWNGPSWDEVESGGFDERSRDNIQCHTKVDKNRTWDFPVSRDASGFSDVVKSKHNSDDKKKLWDGPSWDNVNASCFPNIEESNPNLDDKNRSWNGPSWDEASASAFSNVSMACHNSEDSKKSWNGPSRGTVSASGSSYDAKSGNNIDGKTRSWNGPLWDEVKESGLQSPTVDGQAQHVMPQALGTRLADATTATMTEVPGVSFNQKSRRQGEHNVVIVVNDSDANNASMISDNANQQILTSGKDSIQSLNDMNGTQQSHQMLLSNRFNGPKIQLNRQVQGMFLHMDSQKQMEIHKIESGKPLNSSEIDVGQVRNDMNETSVTSQLAPQVNDLPALFHEIAQKGQLPQVYTELNLANALDFLTSLSNTASSGPCIDKKPNKPVERFSPISTAGHDSCKLGEAGVVHKEYKKSTKQEAVGNREQTDSRVAENAKQEQENINPDNSESEAQGKEEEEKAMRQFKIALVEFVKEILKPTWKEGKMNREVHKTVVKKVVDKVTSTIQGIQVPGTQGKIEQYLAYSKSKITKLVEAYVERLLNA